MQRVRIGLTGLCSVFLLVLLAAAVFGLAPAEKGVRDSAGNQAMANMADNDPKDPLAELGVTPGGNPAPAAAPAVPAVVPEAQPEPGPAPGPVDAPEPVAKPAP